ncbi:carbohydrate ABC transporter permease, partial [Clavibacter michiganensis subsp. insidiosus]
MSTTVHAAGSAAARIADQASERARSDGERTGRPAG